MASFENRQNESVPMQPAPILAFLLVAIPLLLAGPAFAADLCQEIENAAYEGDNEKILELIGQGADVNCQFPDGWTALMHAVYASRIATVRLLLEKGADAYMKKEDGVTAIDMAEAKRKLATSDSTIAEAGQMLNLFAEWEDGLLGWD
ncbi:MAG: ankyrin repeat domain-containing protein [Pseudomonadota bacterium]